MTEPDTIDLPAPVWPPQAAWPETAPRIGGNAKGVFVTGLRGIPDIQGGVERHCQNLYPRMVKSGIPVTVFARSGYVRGSEYDFNGVRVKPISVPRTSSMEAVAHTGLAVLRAKAMGARLLHIHGIGPSLWAPLARSLGMKVVVTHHGFDYNRQKWGNQAKQVLRLGEQNAIRHAHAIVCISKEIENFVRGNWPRGIVATIPNGVERPMGVPTARILEKWGLLPCGYFLLTARFVKEKGILDLIRGWAASVIGDSCKLAIAGGEDHPSSFGDEIRQLAKETGAVLTGVVGGDVLGALYGHARGFVLPSYHEGLPISLLEAMSWGLPLGASSISANLELGLPRETYFEPGNIDGIADRLRHILSGPQRVDHSTRLQIYDWDIIAESTIRLYNQVLHPSRRFVR